MGKKTQINKIAIQALIVIFLPFAIVINSQAMQEEADNTEFIVTSSDDNTLTIKPGEITFQEIELSPEGVVAYDSSGNRWIYNFTTDRFGIADYSNEKEVGFESSIKTELVNQRCIKQLILSSPEVENVFVGYDEFVDGDILALGKVVVKGWVKGDIRSYKMVIVTSTGQVDGDITAPTITVKEGGMLLGEENIADRFTFPHEVFYRNISSAGFWVIFAFTLVFILISFIFSSLAPEQFDNMSNCISMHRLKTTLLGFLFIILLPLIIAIMAVTVIGIIFIPLLALLIVVVMALAICTTGMTIYNLIFKNDEVVRSGRLSACLIGIVVHMLPWVVVAYLLTRLSKLSSGVHEFGIFLLVISIIFSTYHLFAGIGAALLTRLGYRSYVSYSVADADIQKRTGGPVPPPMPKAPPVPSPIIKPPGLSNDQKSDF